MIPHWKKGTGPRRPKYNAQKTKIDGILFDSLSEAKYYCDLKLRLAIGEILKIECHPKYVFQPAYRRCCGVIYRGKDEMHTPRKDICPKCGKKMKAESALFYEADFRVTYPDGRQEVIDVKGVRTRSFEISRKTLEYRHPELTLIVRKV